MRLDGDVRTQTLSFKLHEGLNILSNMRLCSNVLAQFAVEPALRNDSLSQQLTLPMVARKSTKCTWNALNDIPGIAASSQEHLPLPRLDPKFYNIDNDEDLILDVLSSEKILLVQGSAFNIPDNHHFQSYFYHPPINYLML